MTTKTVEMRCCTCNRVFRVEIPLPKPIPPDRVVTLHCPYCAETDIMIANPPTDEEALNDAAAHLEEILETDEQIGREMRAKERREKGGV